MSREIKYRIWSKDYNEYLSDEGYDGYHLALRPDGKLYDADCGIEYAGTRSEAPTLKWRDESDGNDVEQYTGLKDKNGKEIYEGDIVQFNNDYYQVYWSDSDVCFRLGNNKTLWWINTQKQPDMRVVGTIHENPELLGGEE